MNSHGMEMLFLLLQGFNVAFLFLHDWVPLGRLNNFNAMRHEDSMSKRVFATLLGALPAAFGLFYSLRFFGRSYPHAVLTLLSITYFMFLAGLLRAWWIPYLLVADPRRAARYRVIFAGTYRFLPERNGMAPDTLHTLFHLSVVATLAMLLLR